MPIDGRPRRVALVERQDDRSRKPPGVDAVRATRTGRYQLHAAIQSVHNRRAITGVTDWASIAALYDGVIGFDPTITKRRSRSQPRVGRRTRRGAPLDR